jgi:hypothetical protein
MLPIHQGRHMRGQAPCEELRSGREYPEAHWFISVRRRENIPHHHLDPSVRVAQVMPNYGMQRTLSLGGKCSARSTYRFACASLCGRQRGAAMRGVSRHRAAETPHLEK